MTAKNAKKEYGYLDSILRNGNRVSLLNTDGRRVTVPDNQDVYHRGDGRFGIYSTDLDRKRLSRGASSHDKVGTGIYRHWSDERKKKRGF